MARVTVADIARHAGVSTGAVSYALNNKPGVSEATRVRILQIAEEMGWSPAAAARSLSAGSTQTLGLVLARDPATLGVEPFYMRFLAGVETELTTRGYALLLQVVTGPEAELATYRQWLSSRRVDGLIVVDPRLQDPRMDLLRSPAAPPVVVVGEPRFAPGMTCVWTDDESATREAVRYLYALGHRRIARVSGVPEFGHTHLRDNVFWDEIGSLGASGQVVHTDYTALRGASVTRTLLTDTSRPTAILYDNDIMALAGLGVAEELGLRVWEDLSIIAWDDSPLCEASFPRLTALSHDVLRYGAHVARTLFDLIDGRGASSAMDATPSLRTRGSTGRPVG